jgi:hypothetical protein
MTKSEKRVMKAEWNAIGEAMRLPGVSVEAWEAMQKQRIALEYRMAGEVK